MSIGQKFDSLLKNGHVIDPHNGVDGLTDVAIAKGKIAAVASDIDPARLPDTVVAMRGP